MACAFCGKDDSDGLEVRDPCLCPFVKPARPAWQETYPPLYCIACGAVMFRLPDGFSRVVVANVTCGDRCEKEIERRYCRGTVLQREYGDHL